MLDRVRAAVRPERVNSLVKRALDAGDRSRGIYPVLGELAGRWRAGWIVSLLTALLLAPVVWKGARRWPARSSDR